MRGDCPIPQGPCEVILFGGTFDPPHLAHTRLVPRLRDEAAPGAWLLYVPAARSPHKADAPTADAHRVAMLHGALAGVDRAAVWTDELDRAGPSYTIDTLTRLHDARPAARTRLLIGADQAIAFHRWKDARRILTLATPLVMPREPLGDRAALMRALRETGAWSEEELSRWEGWVAPTPLADVSATRLREALRQTPRDREGLLAMLDPRVLGYIEAQGLYAERE